MTDFTIIEAKPWHCGQMARILRVEHQRGFAEFGLDAHGELRGTFDASSFRRAWLIDGRLAAVGGIVGSELESTGYVWAALSERARRYPIELVKEARRQLKEIMVLKKELACTVIPADSASCRFAAFLGFHVARAGRGQRALSGFSRRDLVRYLAEDPELRVPVGNGHVVAMGYHGEAA